MKIDGVTRENVENNFTLKKTNLRVVESQDLEERLSRTFTCQLGGLPSAMIRQADNSEANGHRNPFRLHPFKGKGFFFSLPVHRRTSFLVSLRVFKRRLKFVYYTSRVQAEPFPFFFSWTMFYCQGEASGKWPSLHCRFQRRAMERVIKRIPRSTPFPETFEVQLSSSPFFFFLSLFLLNFLRRTRKYFSTVACFYTLFLNPLHSRHVSTVHFRQYFPGKFLLEAGNIGE